MKAIVRDRWGGPDVVRLEEIATPDPAAGEVLVRIHAASVNRADLDGLEPRPGFLRMFMGIRAPRARRVGIDVAGVVEKAGPGAARFAVGDRVFTDLFTAGMPGAFAEFISVPERVLQPIPPSISSYVTSTICVRVDSIATIARAPGGDQQADRRSDRRQHQALDEELPHQSPASGAE